MPHLTHDAIAIRQPAPDGRGVAPSVAREAARGLGACWAVAGEGCGVSGIRPARPATRPERLQSPVSSVR